MVLIYHTSIYYNTEHPLNSAGFINFYWTGQTHKYYIVHTGESVVVGVGGS